MADGPIIEPDELDYELVPAPPEGPVGPFSADDFEEAFPTLPSRGDDALFDVVLVDAGVRKIAAMKEVRRATGAGLTKAKDLIDRPPAIVKEAVAAEQAHAIRAALERVGARVEVRAATSVAPELSSPPEAELMAEAAPEIIFDKSDQLSKVKAALLPTETLEAVLDLQGIGTGFLGITDKRLIVQDHREITSVPYSRITSVRAEGKGFFDTSSKLGVTASGCDPFKFEFREKEKARRAHDLILSHIL